MGNSSQSSVSFFFELGMMRRQKHSGGYLSGLENPQSLSDHAFRAAVIGFFLGYYEEVDPFRIAGILLFHDVPECRIGDHHKVASRYIDAKPAEEAVIKDQTASFPEGLRDEIVSAYISTENRDTQEGIVAKDADWLEMAINAREYIVKGYAGYEDVINNVEKALETKTAQKWIKEIRNADPNDWWKGLKKMTYTKLSNN